MKKELLLILATLASLFSYSQNCNMIKNEVDEFTGDVIKMTEFVKINKKFTSRYYFSHSLTNINGDYVLTMKLIGGGQSLFIESEQSLHLKLSNNSIISLNTSKAYPTEFEVVYGGGTMSIIKPDYVITKEQLMQIKNTGLIKIRQETADGYYESDVTEKDNKALRQSIECIL